jgi:biopolymer transport protein TolR
MSDINMTPLVDVMLVLVVIFILTAPLLASSIRLDLPQAEGAGARCGALNLSPWWWMPRARPSG